MTKKKSGSQANSLSELDFVAQVQLEDAVRLIGTFGDNRYEVYLDEISYGHWQYKIKYSPYNEKYELEVSGTLERWQGTDTRIRADNHTIPNIRIIFSNKPFFYFLLVLVIILASLVAVFSDYWQQDIQIISVIALTIGIPIWLSYRGSPTNEILENSVNEVFQHLITYFNTRIETYVIDGNQNEIVWHTTDAQQMEQSS